MATEYVDSAVETVLSTSRLKLAHPGNAKLTQVYPTPSESTSVLAQAINHRGQFRIAPNNQNLNSRSDFIVSSSALLSEFVINGEIRYTNLVQGQYIKPGQNGWGFNLIDSIEVTYSNSLMQNMFIRGQTLKDYSLLCCQSKIERQDLLTHAGSIYNIDNAGDAENVYQFSVPITFLNHTVASLRNSWPIDGSVLAGPIQISVNWRRVEDVFTRSTNFVVTYPTSFSKLTLSCKTTQLQDASFSVKKAMMLDPQLVYSIPARYITSVDYSRSIVAGSSSTINLASAPSGMLEGIIVSIRPTTGAVLADNWVNPIGTGTGPKFGSVTLSSLSLEFGGQFIMNCETNEEWQHYIRSTMGDNLRWTEVISNDVDTVEPSDPGWGLFHDVYFIPLVNSGSDVFRGHTNENVPSYGGSQLQLKITPSTRQRALDGLNSNVGNGIGGEAYTYYGPEAALSQGGSNYEIWIGYVISALLEVSQGTVDLQL
jgi:hypothetical protein